MIGLLGASSPIVDWAKLGQVVLYSLVVGVGVALSFSIAVVGATRFNERRRADGGGSTGAAIGYGALAALGLAATVGAAVAGIIVMTTKT
jgi:hypothetical protein